MATVAVAPGPDVSIAPRLVGVTATLYVVVLSVYSFRIYTRIWPVRTLGWDDLAISLALLCAIVEWGILLAAVPHGLGRHNFYVSPTDQISASRYLFSSQPPWGWSIAFIKISMALMFLRIKRTPGWQRFLFGMIGLQIATAVAANCAQFLQCRPLAALWDPKTPNVKCWPVQGAQASIYINSVIGICTDIVFSLLPITFIRKLSRPFWEKVVLCCLMGLGIFASITSIVKTTLIKNYGKTGDALWDSVGISMWSILEEQIGITAACIPCLKSPFEKLLRRVGIVTSYGSRSRGRSDYVYANDATQHELHTSTNVTSRSRVDVESKSPFAASMDTILPKKDIEAGDGEILKTTEFRVHAS